MSDLPSVSLNGARVTAARVTIPYYGTWVADVTIALTSAIPANSTLVLGDLSLVGFVTRAASFAGARSVRMVGGFGGWSTMLTPRTYRSSSGVNVSTVLSDAAIEVGEKVNLAADSSLGASYVREVCPASRLLRQVGGPLWWVDGEGTTQVGARPTGAIKSAFTVISYSGGRGKLEIATETPSEWLPGRSFSSPTVTTPVTIGSVSHVVDNSGVARVEVLSNV